MKHVLFLCTGNSCRSQMAEGWARHLYSGLPGWSFHSAGTRTHGLNQRAVQVMREAGVDISSHHSKTLVDLSGIDFDFVFTVCDNAHESCPTLPGARIIHVGFDDPPHLTRDMDEEESVLAVYRRVRDDIKDFIDDLSKYIPLS